MSDDIVERLRNCGPFLASDGYMSTRVLPSSTAHEAAAEIERLRAAQVRHVAELDEMADRIEQLVMKGGSGGSLRLRLFGLVSELREKGDRS